MSETEQSVPRYELYYQRFTANPYITTRACKGDEIKVCKGHLQRRRVLVRLVVPPHDSVHEAILPRVVLFQNRRCVGLPKDKNGEGGAGYDTTTAAELQEKDHQPVAGPIRLTAPLHHTGCVMLSAQHGMRGRRSPTPVLLP